MTFKKTYVIIRSEFVERDKKMEKNNFVKIDKEFYNTLSSKEILILLYLYNKSLTLEYFNFTLKDLIVYYGYKPNSRKNQINQLFIKAINDLIDKNIIFLTSSPIKNINQLNTGGFIKDKKGNTYFDTLEQFVICYNSEINILSKAVTKNITICSLENLVKLYLYLKKFLHMNNPLLYCYPSLNTISKDLHMSKPTILKALIDLETLGLVYKKNIGNYIDKHGKTFVCNNVYCFENYDVEIIKQDISHSSSFYNFCKWY